MMKIKDNIAGLESSEGNVIKHILLYITRIFKGDWQTRVVKNFIFTLLFFAVFGNFVANDKPLYCKIDGKTYFPIFKEILVDLGLAQWPKELFSGSWSEYKYQRIVMPPIPYSATSIDVNNMKLMVPFAKGSGQSNFYRHWLGTDSLGRDTLAGMIRGARIAVWIGFGAMTLASFIGLFFGMFAGYYGDKSFKLNISSIVLSIFFLISWLYFLYTYFTILSNEVAISPFVIIVITLLHLGLYYVLNLIFIKIFKNQKKFNIPLDLILMRFIEVFKTIPALILLLALIAIISKPSVFSMIIILAFLLWPTIARFSRAEMLKIREEDYINSARIMGLSDLKIIFKHALPNAIAPILVVIAFGISSAILLEATLSFLGLGLAFDDVSWGSMLSEARKNFKAWWLALFPGIAIFFTIAAFNIIGDKIQSLLKSN